MQNLISLLGLTDDTGQTSSMRIVLYTVVLAILVPDVAIAIKTSTSLAFTSQQIEVLSAVLGAKLVQNHQENSAPQPPKV